MKRPNRISPFVVATTISAISLFAPPIAAQGSVASDMSIASAKASEDLAPMRRLALEPEIRAALQMRVDSQHRLEGQAPIIVVGAVTFNREGNKLTVELGKDYVPKYNGGELEDALGELANVVYAHMEKIAPIYWVDFTFEGKAIFDYFPYERGLIEQAEMGRDARTVRKADAGKGRVLISAGHGYYFHRKNGWSLQRSLWNGIIEDFATPAFASLLDQYMSERSGAEVFRARSLALTKHSESDKPWYSMAARYHLEEMLPGMPEIWNSKPGEGGDMEQYNQDIRSRPLYANHLSVDAAIHLHTNADAPELRGIRIYHAPGRKDDSRLASLALCYIKESLHSNATYENFPVAGVPHAENHGENSYANVPSIIAEMGFHTNKEDALAIGNHVFRDLTMRGLEKGYRMFREGRDCEPFTADHPDVDLISGASAIAVAKFGGAPRFPIKFTLLVTECPAGITCASRQGKFKNPDGAFSIDYTCRTQGAQPFTIKWDAVFTDADGIKARAPFAMTCKPKANAPS